MVKTKDPTGKGKAAASSSGSRRPAKKRQLNLQDESSSDEAPRTRIQADRRNPNLATHSTESFSRLSKYPIDQQPHEFNQRINSLGKRAEGFLVERDLTDPDYRAFGLIQKFEKLGWQAGLRVYDREDRQIYMDPVQEWMATLVFKRGRNHPRDSTLTGTVGQKQIVMSFRTLDQIGNFDARSDVTYQYPDPTILYSAMDKQPNWHEMNVELYEAGAGGRFDRKNLKMPVRLLLLFVIRNFMPRRGDLSSVRTWEVPILYALMRGSPYISLKYLIMMNIWEARDVMGKQYIPHVRLITALLKLHDVDMQDYHGTKKELGPLRAGGLSKMHLAFKRTDRYLRFKHEISGKKWKVLRPDARQLEEGEEDEQSSGHAPSFVQGGGEGSSGGVHGMPQFPYFASQPSFTGSTYTGHLYPFGGGDFNMPQYVEERRPSSFSQWTDYEQASFDRDTAAHEQARRDARSIYDRMEHWNQVHAINQETEINLRYMDDNQRRMREQRRSGEQVVERPPFVDFSTLPPYTEGDDYPVPAIHHSQWIDPYSQQQFMQGQQAPPDQGSSGETGSAFDFGPWQSTMRSIFGDPKPPYY